MMKNEFDDLNEIIVNTVLKNIPKNIKPVIYLMELLDLSRESVYRRIRKDIPFSMDELTKLALTLNFSLDEIVEGSKRERIFFDLGLRTPNNSMDSFSAVFQEYNSYISNLSKAKNSSVFMALNCIYPLFTVFFSNLFKFHYFKWLVETQDNLPKDYFSNLVLPQELSALKQKISEEIKCAQNVTIILSPNISLSIIKDIQYYYQRKLINKDDLEILKKDLLKMSDFSENVAKTGRLGNGNSQIDIYISIPYINSNTIYLEYDDASEVHYWIYSNNPMVIKNSEISNIQKKWFLSLKKSSTLITQSNEILQADFFDTQRKLINKLMVENGEKILVYA
ncbi:MAG: hypothetical protein LBC48_04325 [Dysgonamonadaceae bacterium]|jgi:hypothetical protein|nr:hypothetical protein [Dysgonamonadaceae bacterium]